MGLYIKGLSVWVQSKLDPCPKEQNRTALPDANQQCQSLKANSRQRIRRWKYRRISSCHTASLHSVFLSPCPPIRIASLSLIIHNAWPQRADGTRSAYTIHTTTTTNYIHRRLSDNYFLKKIFNRHGPKIGGCCAPSLLFCWGGAGPITQYSLGWGLPSCQVASWSIELFGHNTPTLQLTSQTDTDSRRSDSRGRTVLETVVQI